MFLRILSSSTRLPHVVSRYGRGPAAVALATKVDSRRAMPSLGGHASSKTSAAVLGASRSYSSTHVVKAFPSYQIYGETAALTVKVVPPEFRTLQPSGTVVLDSSKRGRLLLEWTERNMATGKFHWDRPIRFALSAEEAGLLLHRSSKGEGVELSRLRPGGGGQYFDQDQPPPPGDAGLQKVFRMFPEEKDTVTMVVDFEAEGKGGQEPPSAYEAQGPLSVDVMVGEFRVLQSIIEYTMPRLVGWPTMLDFSLDKAFNAGQSYGGNANNNRGSGRSGGGGGFFDDGSEGNVPF